MVVPARGGLSVSVAGRKGPALAPAKTPHTKPFLAGYLMVASGAAALFLGGPLPFALLGLLGIPLLLIGRDNLSWFDLPLVALLLAAMAWAAGRNMPDLGWGVTLLLGLMIVGGSLTEAYLRRERIRSIAQHETEDRSGAGDLIASIAAVMNGITPSEIDLGVERALQQIGIHFQLDGLFVLQEIPEGKLLTCTHSWWDGDWKPPIEWQEGVECEQMPWLWKELAHCTSFSFGTLDILPAEAQAERSFFERGSIRSACLVPLRHGDSLSGVLGHASFHEDRDWSESHKTLFRTLADLLVSGLERKRTALALLESEERYSRLSGGVSEGIWDWDLKTDVVVYSARWRSMLGDQARELRAGSKEWLDRVHLQDLAGVKLALSNHLSGRTPAFECEHRLRDSGGAYRWMLSRGTAIRSLDGRPLRITGSLTDINDRRIVEERLNHDALHDDLTGLPNRVLFIDRLEHSLGRHRRNKDRLCAVLFLDLDRFKIVNDSLGPNVGDQLLIEVGNRLEDSVRQVDTVARLGGDEFTVLLDDIKDISDATRVAERILNALQKPLDLNGQVIFTTGSIGIALSGKDTAVADDLMRNADIAMYRAKSQGKARYEVFDTAMRARAMALLKLETDLRRAIERSEFMLAYQPIVAIESGRITGFEALLRWTHPQRGRLMPKDFLATAEETGLIVPIGWEVLARACRQAAAWERKFRLDPPLTISVNLSGKQLRQGDLVEQVRRALEDSGLSPHSLKLEITEGIIMADLDAARSAFDGLRKLGVQLHLDDFGTGYSSLSVLHSFQVDTLKIDRSFVRNMFEDPRNGGIVDTIVGLAQVLGKEVVAEGVETREQLVRLGDLRCQYAQGYYFSLPVDAASISGMLGMGIRDAAGMLALPTGIETSPARDPNWGGPSPASSPFVPVRTK